MGSPNSKMEGQMAFVVKDSIPLLINNSMRTIELCLGNMSELDMPNKVDIMLISALPGSYKAHAGSVIQALSNNLNVSVADLANNKEVDKRDTHKCWWSKPIQQPHVPFERLMCYESGGGEAAAAEFTNTTFSCLKELYQKQPFKLASSLLNTGRQKMDEVVVLEAIVEAAILAMKDGLNLRQLMIFVNAENKGGANFAPKVSNFKGICDKFGELKRKNTNY